MGKFNPVFRPPLPFIGNKSGFVRQFLPIMKTWFNHDRLLVIEPFGGTGILSNNTIRYAKSIGRTGEDFASIYNDASGYLDRVRLRDEGHTAKIVAKIMDIAFKGDKKLIASIGRNRLPVIRDSATFLSVMRAIDLHKIELRNRIDYETISSVLYAKRHDTNTFRARDTKTWERTKMHVRYSSGSTLGPTTYHKEFDVVMHADWADVAEEAEMKAAQFDNPPYVVTIFDPPYPTTCNPYNTDKFSGNEYIDSMFTFADMSDEMIVFGGRYVLPGENESIAYVKKALRECFTEGSIEYLKCEITSQNMGVKKNDEALHVVRQPAK